LAKRGEKHGLWSATLSAKKRPPLCRRPKIEEGKRNSILIAKEHFLRNGGKAILEMSISVVAKRLPGEGEDTMKFLCLIYDEEKKWAVMPKAEVETVMAEYRAFTESIKKSGQYIGGERLQPTRAARTVRIRNGKTSATDGPFAETKEQLGGFYLIDAKDISDAVEVASRIPSARLGSIEVRPIFG